MQLEITAIQNENSILAHSIARVVYAETLASSLRVIEALTSMIANATKNNRHEIISMLSNKNIFESLNNESIRHKYLFVDTSKREFLVCLRVATRMLRGNLCDMCNHATKFHRADLLPKWAIARGYVADIDDILFYT